MEAQPRTILPLLALVLAGLLTACGSGGGATESSDAEEAWLDGLHDRSELLFGPMEGIEVTRVATYPTPKTYSSFVGSIFEGTSLTVGEVLRALPPEHAFWKRHPERLTALQSANSGDEIGSLLDLATYEEPEWEASKESYARSMQWFRLTQVVVLLEDAPEGEGLSSELVEAVVAKLEGEQAGRGEAWRAAHTAFVEARGRAARSESLAALRSLTSAQADRSSLGHFHEMHGEDADLAFLYEMFQLKWRVKSGLFDPDAPRWN